MRRNKKISCQRREICVHIIISFSFTPHEKGTLSVSFSIKRSFILKVVYKGSDVNNNHISVQVNGRTVAALPVLSLY